MVIQLFVSESFKPFGLQNSDLNHLFDTTIKNIDKRLLKNDKINFTIDECIKNRVP
jgi:hypothetical protein